MDEGKPDIIKGLSETIAKAYDLQPPDLGQQIADLLMRVGELERRVSRLAADNDSP